MRCLSSSNMVPKRGAKGENSTEFTRENPPKIKRTPKVVEEIEKIEIPEFEGFQKRIST